MSSEINKITLSFKDMDRDLYHNEELTQNEVDNIVFMIKRLVKKVEELTEKKVVEATVDHKRI